jgi:hypothetical protein
MARVHVEVEWEASDPQTIRRVTTSSSGRNGEVVKLLDESAAGVGRPAVMTLRWPFGPDQLDIRLDDELRPPIQDTFVELGTKHPTRASIWGPVDPADPGSLVEPRDFLNTVDSADLVVEVPARIHASHRELDLEFANAQDGLALRDADRDPILCGRGRVVRRLDLLQFPTGAHRQTLLVTGSNRESGQRESVAKIPITLRVIDLLDAKTSTSPVQVDPASRTASCVFTGRVTARGPIKGDVETMSCELKLLVAQRNGVLEVQVVPLAWTCAYQFAGSDAYFNIPPTAFLAGFLKSDADGLLGYAHWLSYLVGGILAGFAVESVKAALAALLQLFGPEIGVPGTLILFSPKVEAILPYLVKTCGRYAGKELNKKIAEVIDEARERENQGSAPCRDGETRQTRGDVQTRSVVDRVFNLQYGSRITYCVRIATEEYRVWTTEVCQGGTWVDGGSNEQVIRRTTRVHRFTSEAERQQFIQDTAAD